MSDYHEWNQKIVEEFRANAGHVGGPFEGAPILVLHTTGRKSGEQRINPMMYLEDQGRLYVFASKAGADSHPDWFHNLIASSHVTVELGTESFRAHARPVEGPERDRIYAMQSELRPNFAEYQEKTSRIIPVVELVRES